MPKSTTARIKDDARIDELRDERAEGNGWFVYLKTGFAYSDANTNSAAHCFGEDRLGDVLRSLRSVKPCACSECLSLRKTK